MRSHVAVNLLPFPSRRGLASSCLALLVPLAWSTMARAQGVTCGSVVGPNQVVALDADLQCTRATGGITVVGPATLDLGGSTVTCAAETERATGIVLAGKRATVRNGAVTGCKAGIEVGGDGHHRIEQVAVTTNVEAGFRITSAANKLRGNTAAGTTGGVDFVVRSDRNLLEGNTTAAAGLTPSPLGFHVIGNENRLRGNSAADHQTRGFHVAFPFQHNVLLRNTASRNGEGIRVDGPHTSLTANAVVENDGDGIFVAAPGARVTRNDVRGNGRSGIRLFADVGDAVIARNSALGNDRRGLDAFDLDDPSPGCSTNRWRGNVFATASQGCIE